MVSENAWIILVCGLFGGLITLLQEAKGTFGFSRLVSGFCVNERRTLLTSFIMGILIFVDDYLNVLSIGVCMKGVYDKRKIPRETLAYILDATGAPVCVILPFSTWTVFYFQSVYRTGKYKSTGIQKRHGRLYPCSSLCIDGNIRYYLIPMIILVAISIITGDLLLAVVIVLIVCFILYVPMKAVSWDEFFSLLFRGFGDMLSVLTILVAAFILQKVTEEMGMTAFIIRMVQPFLKGAKFPAIAFILVTVLTFTTASQWGISAVASSIVFPLGAAVGANPILIMAAIISGGAFGIHACFYTDSTVLASSSAGIDNMEHAVSQLPYVLLACILSIVCYLICGYMM